MADPVQQGNPCPHCVDYVGKCPYCHSTRPAIRHQSNPSEVLNRPGFENWPRLIRQWSEDEKLNADPHTRILAGDLRRLLTWIEAAQRGTHG